MTDPLPAELIIQTRDESRDYWLKKYSIRNPSTAAQPVDTTPGSYPYIRASVYADAVMPLFANAKINADAEGLDGKSGDALTEYGTTQGIPSPAGLPATGSLGLVSISASVGGATIVGTDTVPGGGLEFRTASGARFQATRTGTYLSGALVPIAAVDTGSQTNIAAGTQLTITSAPYGLSPTAVVVAAADGSGLSGGGDAETDADRRDRFRSFNANPPAAGNDAAYQSAVENMVGLAVQKCFTWPAIDGSGSTGIAFTMQPVTGQSRAPNSTEVALVRTQIAGSFPGDDSQFVMSLTSVPITLALGIRWKRTAAVWADATPWPTGPIDGALPFVSSVLTPTDSVLRIAYPTSALDALSATPPQIGQTIGLFDVATATWKRKRILTLSTPAPGAGETIAWQLTFDMTASDSYVATVGQVVSPWSDSLASLVTPVETYFQNTGPGEVFSTIFDAVSRRIRQPETPEWPSTLDTPITAPLLELSTTSSVTVLLPTLPYVCPIGTPTISANLLELGALAAYAI